jgi:hypothetical protein
MTLGALSSTSCNWTRCPGYVAFDLLIADGIDLRPLPLQQRKARLARLGERAEGWIALTNGVVGEDGYFSGPLVDADVQGIILGHRFGVIYWGATLFCNLIT